MFVTTMMPVMASKHAIRRRELAWQEPPWTVRIDLVVVVRQKFVTLFLEFVSTIRLPMGKMVFVMYWKLVRLVQETAPSHHLQWCVEMVFANRVKIAIIVHRTARALRVVIPTKDFVAREERQVVVKIADATAGGKCAP